MTRQKCEENMKIYFILVKYLQSEGNRNTYSQTATAMGTLYKSSNSLYLVLFLNERGRL